MSSALYRSTVLATSTPPDTYWPLQNTDPKIDYEVDITGNEYYASYAYNELLDQPSAFPDGRSVLMKTNAESRVYSPTFNNFSVFSITFLFNAGLRVNTGQLMIRSASQDQKNSYTTYYYDTRIGVNSTGQLTLDDTLTATNPDICDGNWHHIAITSDTSDFRIYVDGSVVLHTLYNAQKFFGSFSFGSSGGNTFGAFPGYFSEIAMWFNYRVSISEIAQHYKILYPSGNTTTTTTTAQSVQPSTTTTTTTTTAVPPQPSKNQENATSIYTWVSVIALVLVVLIILFIAKVK